MEHRRAFSSQERVSFFFFSPTVPISCGCVLCPIVFGFGGCFFFFLHFLQIIPLVYPFALGGGRLEAFFHPLACSILFDPYAPVEKGIPALRPKLCHQQNSHSSAISDPDC